MSVVEIVVFCAVAVIALGPAVSSYFTPRSDLLAIKGAYEGPNGLAGADKTVVAIERIGDEPEKGSRIFRYRTYRVTLEGPDGVRQDKAVGMDIVLFGTGNMRELD